MTLTLEFWSEAVSFPSVDSLIVQRQGSGEGLLSIPVRLDRVNVAIAGGSLRQLVTLKHETFSGFVDRE